MAANLPSIAITDDINSPDYDAIVVVSPDVKSISLDRVKDPLTTYLSSNRILPSIFVTKLLPFWFILLAAQLWVDTSHLSTAVAWREKKFKHFVFYKYFCLVLGLLKSRISKKSNEGLERNEIRATVFLKWTDFSPNTRQKYL